MPLSWIIRALSVCPAKFRPFKEAVTPYLPVTLQSIWYVTYGTSYIKFGIRLIRARRSATPDIIKNVIGKFTAQKWLENIAAQV